MTTGAITAYIDVAQITLYAFWIFFAGLVYYLHRENKREGYPLEAEHDAGRKTEGFPRMPPPKTFRLPGGRTVSVPLARDAAPRAPLAAVQAGYRGSPLVPTGNPFADNIGPGAWSERADVPDWTMDGALRLQPLRLVPGCAVAEEDPDPRGMRVVGADGAVGGTVTDLWVDVAEMVFRYLEVEVAGGGTVLLPINFARIDDRRVQVHSILSTQFAAVPRPKQPDRITLLEEERVMAYYGAGTLYATPSRAEPLL